MSDSAYTLVEWRHKFPFVSFVVPVYNAERTIVRCVNSLVSQTFDDVEILLVNNCSTDSSLQICKDFSEKYSRVRTFDIAEKGVSVARNKGIEESLGEFISFVDADDWIDSNVCEIFARLNKKNHYDLFCYSAQYHKNSKTTKSFLFAEDIEHFSQEQKEELQIKILAPQAPEFEYKVNTRFAGAVWGKFYKREILLRQNLRFSKETIISEDVLFNTFALDLFTSIGYSSKCFYHYEQQTGSAQNKYRPNSDKYFGFVINQIQGWLKWTNKSQKYVDAANCLFVHYLFGVLKEDVFHKDNLSSVKGKIQQLNNALNNPVFADILQKSNSVYFTPFEKMIFFCLKKRFKFIFVVVGVVSKGL